MDDLREKLKRNHLQFQRDLSKIVVEYWGQLNTCKVLPVSKDLAYVFDENIDSMIKISEYIDQVFKNWPTFKMLKSDLHRSFSVLIKIALEENLNSLVELLVTTYAIYTHFSLIKKYLKFCDQNTYQLALDTLPGQHLFKQKNTIAEALSYISSSLLERWKNKIKNSSDSIYMIRLLFDIRSRWEQSIKSLMIRYYKIKKGEIDIVVVKTGISEKEEYAVDDRFEILIERVVQRLIIYKTINQDLLKVISNKIGLKLKYFQPLIEILTQVDEDIIRVLCYIIIDNELYDAFINKDYLKILTKKMSVRYTKNKDSIKEKIDEYIIRLANKYDPEYLKLYTKLSRPYKQKIRVAFVYYIYFNMTH